MAFTPMFRKPFTQLVCESSATAVQTYQEKVVALSPIAYWPLTEASGTTATELMSAMNGTYARDVSTMTTGAGPIAGQTAPVFTAATPDFVTLPYASLTGVNKSEGAACGWLKVSGSGVWADNTVRVIFYLQYINNSHYIALYKSLGANDDKIYAEYKSNITTKSAPTGALSTTDWLHIGMSWSITSDALKIYLNGSQVGSTITGLVVPTGALALSLLCANTGVGGAPWSGLLAHWVIMGSPQADSFFLSLATP